MSLLPGSSPDRTQGGRNNSPKFRNWLKAGLTEPRYVGGLGLLLPGLWLAWLAFATVGGAKTIYASGAVALSAAGLAQLLAAVVDYVKASGERSKKRFDALDEARRVCLIALTTRSPEAIVTMVNSLTYHSQILPAAHTPELLTWARNPGRLQGATADRYERRVFAYVNELCQLRGDAPMFPEKAIGDVNV